MVAPGRARTAGRRQTGRMPSVARLVVLPHGSSVFFPRDAGGGGPGRGSYDEIPRDMPVTGALYASYERLKGIVVVCRDFERGCCLPARGGTPRGPARR